MSQTYGIEAPGSPHGHGGGGVGDSPLLPPAKYLVLIDSAAHDQRLARLFLASREAVAEFDASAPEVLLMTQGLAAQHGAQQPEWDGALGAHSAAERAAALVYTLDA